MHLLWLLTMALVALWHLQLITCDDISLHLPTQTINGGLQQNPGPNGLGSTGLPTGQNIGLVNQQSTGSNLNQLAGNSSLLNTLMNGNPGLNGLTSSMGGGNSLMGSVAGMGGSGLMGHSSGGSMGSHGPGGGGGGGSSGVHHGHALAGLANLGIVVPGHRMASGATNSDSGGRYNPSYMGAGSIDSMSGGGNSMGGGSQYYEQEHFISEHTVMAVFTSQGQMGGPCRYMPATRRQNHQCRKEFGLPDTIREARRLATTHCEDQFRYDRWNCSIEIRGKRNIFKKLYKETAFVHALTAAAMTHSIARACSEGRMTKCSCGPRKHNRPDQTFEWGGCNDNLKHGKRVTRSFLDLRGGESDEVTEILRHDSEVGIEAVSTMMKDKCKCHGVSGSCSMKTCWKKLADFNATATLLRQKYNQAIRKAPNTRTMRREATSSRVKKPKQRRKKQQQSQYTTLYYLETSPTYCSVTKDRQCLNPDNCANLCCGRGYVTRVFKQVEKCRCRFNNGRCCQLICDYCQRYEDRFFCK
ncbi:protein Wnt-4 [Stomoxys calcitrans]|uniref:protein Wnt-4 n=1 Tax=Stomoxys calcitrans TaxID=35570 RepID=UPI0027E32B58|nr:protein Wnt-4 [Stomoxys calcitrans]